MNRVLTILILILSFGSVAQTINTVAGTGTAGFTGNGGPATSANCEYVWDVEVDAAGNVYLSETTNSVIRRVDAVTGVITNFFGNGTFGEGSPGESGPDYELKYPAFMEIHNNYLYVSDYVMHKILKVSLLDSSVYTVAGTGTDGYTADGGVADVSQINNPMGLAFGTDGNLYFSENGNHLIRKIDANGYLATVAGIQGVNGVLNGSVSTATVDSPYGLSIDNNNDVFFCDVQACLIRKIDQSSNLLSTFAGTTCGFSGDSGPAISAQFSVPHDLQFDTNGDLLVGDTENNRIRRIDGNTSIVTTIAGDGTPGYSGDGGDPLDAQLDAPLGICVNANNDLFFAELDNNIVRSTSSCVDPDLPEVVILNSAGVNDTVHCPGTLTLIISTGELNSADGWYWSTDGCGGNTFNIGPNTFYNIDSDITVAVWGGGGCSPNPPCTKINLYISDCSEDDVIEQATSFSPNGDNVNDEFYLEMAENHPVNIVTIYNRWGDPVRTFNNYTNNTNSWDGRDEFGVWVGVGTYFYIFESGNIQRNGWVHVVK